MGKSTISMVIFNSFLYVYRRVLAPSKHHSRTLQWGLKLTFDTWEIACIKSEFPAGFFGRGNVQIWRTPSKSFTSLVANVYKTSCKWMIGVNMTQQTKTPHIKKTKKNLRERVLSLASHEGGCRYSEITSHRSFKISVLFPYNAQSWSASIFRLAAVHHQWGNPYGLQMPCEPGTLWCDQTWQNGKTT